MYDIGICSGYFSVLHEGHIQYLEKAKKQCRYLIVIVNSDRQYKQKYENEPCISYEARRDIVEAIKYVDMIYAAIDNDQSVAETLKKIRGHFPAHWIAFFNSGDRNNNTKNDKEHQVCEANRIAEVFIDCPKVNSSSKIMTKIGEQYLEKHIGVTKDNLHTVHPRPYYTVGIGVTHDNVAWNVYNPPKIREYTDQDGWRVSREPTNEYLKVLEKTLGDTKIQEGLEKATELIKNAERVFLIGNGGSHLSCCCHIQEDLSKCCGINALCLTNPGEITALANDCGYNNIYTNWLRNNKITDDDVLIAVSSSGNSSNIKEALTCVNNDRLITFTAMKKDNKIALFHHHGLHFYIPTMIYGVAETISEILLHMIVDKLSKEKKN